MMFTIVLIISVFIYEFKCCDVLEDKIYGHEMGMDWNYLVNVTELGRGAYIGNVKKINISLTGIFFDSIIFVHFTHVQGVTIFVRPSVRLSVRPVQVCLELSIFIFLAQIFKLTSISQSAVI